MASIIGHRIDYNRVGVLSERPAAYIQQKLTRVPLRGLYIIFHINGTVNTVFTRIIAGGFISFSHEKGAIIRGKAIIRGRRLFQILFTGSRALNILFNFPIK